MFCSNHFCAIRRPRGNAAEGSVWAFWSRRKWFTDQVLRILGSILGPKWEEFEGVFGWNMLSANDLQTHDPTRNRSSKTGRWGRFVGRKSFYEGHLQRGKGLLKEFAAACCCPAKPYKHASGFFVGRFVRPSGKSRVGTAHRCHPADCGPGRKDADSVVKDRAPGRGHIRTCWLSY